MADKIKCPLCGSTNTRDSEVKAALEAAGKVVGKIASIGLVPITGFWGDAINRTVSKGISETTGAVTGALWHVRVCKSCGHSWNYLFD